MRPTHVAALGLAAVTVVAACMKVPYTGRKQANLVPDVMMNNLGKSSYAELLGGATLQKTGQNHTVLSRVGGLISKAADKPNYDWQFSMIQDDNINAWCLPGGYIGFYTGILPVLQSEAGMAFVMGHEVGHATARHGAERLSQNLAVMGGLAGLSVLLDAKTKMSDEQRAIAMGAIGVGVQVGAVLPFSRAHESEADVIGLMYMATAGYPPGESVKVWDRMAAIAPSSTPAFLSTHPAPAKRQEKLREWMPQARKRYQRNKLGGDTLAVLWGDASPASEAPDRSTPTEGKPKPR